MENAIITINMVTRLMNAKRNQNLKANVTNVRNMDTNHQNEKNDIESNITNCESNIWLGLQHLVQMSLLWRIWTHWNELCKTSYEEKRYY